MLVQAEEKFLLQLAIFQISVDSDIKIQINALAWTIEMKKQLSLSLKCEQKASNIKHILNHKLKGV